MANGAEYEKIEEAIKKLDVVPRQVLVEVTIAEVTLSGALNYGLEWFFNSNNNLSGMLFNSDSKIRALPSDPTGAVTPKLPFSAVWRASGGNISAVLSALASNTKVNVLSSPHIMVTDNQVAKINVGSSVPVQGQSTITGLPGSTPITTSVSYVDTGVVLSVRPHINAGGLVTLEISQEVSDVQVGRYHGRSQFTHHQQALRTDHRGSAVRRHHGLGRADQGRQERRFFRFTVPVRHSCGGSLFWCQVRLHHAPRTHHHHHAARGE
jgi:type II secretory pathway component GspD/PulD (secretin)